MLRNFFGSHFYFIFPFYIYSWVQRTSNFLFFFGKSHKLPIPNFELKHSTFPQCLLSNFPVKSLGCCHLSLASTNNTPIANTAHIHKSINSKVPELKRNLRLTQKAKNFPHRGKKEEERDGEKALRGSNGRKHCDPQRVTLRRPSPS